MIEVLGLCVLVSTLLLPVLTLSTRSVAEHREVLERAVAQQLCLDVLERFKRYKPQWAMPGTPGAGGAGLEEMYLPVDLDPGRATLFERAYLDQIASMRMRLAPRIERWLDPARPGLFRLTVSIAWTGARGHAREVRFQRWCWAP